ncbi:MAG: hypothetical protein HDQ88_06950, partial [Clostridia bacterium]|nr:hypothetical protein [Clostridia bacterium]
HTLPTSTVIAKRKSDGKLVSASSDASGNLTMTLEDGDWNIVAINGDVCVDKLVKIPTTTPYVEILEASGSIFTLYVTTLKNVPITSVYTDGTIVIDEADSTGFSVVLLEKHGDWNITAKDSDNNDKSIFININDSSHVLKLDFRTGDIGGGGAEEEPVVKQFFATIVGMPYSTIYAINPITGDATSGTADDDGKVTLEFPCSGLWRAFSIDGSTYYDGVAIISPTGAVTSTRIVGNTGTIFIVYLTTDKGANYTFTHTDGSQVTGQADYDSGFDTVFLPKTGTWTLNTNAAGKTTTKNVVVENVGELLRVRSKA